MTDKPARPLTTKQRRFVEEYLVDFNGAHAAKRAGYQGNGNTLRSVASQNLTKPNIKAKIKARLQALSMTTDEALMRLGEMARAGHTAYFKKDGKVDLEKLIKDDKEHLIKGTKMVRGELVVEWHDPQRAIDMILKAQGAYQTNIDIKSDGEKLESSQVIIILPDNQRGDRNDDDND